MASVNLGLVLSESKTGKPCRTHQLANPLAEVAGRKVFAIRPSENQIPIGVVSAIRLAMAILLPLVLPLHFEHLRRNRKSPSLAGFWWT